MPQKGSARIVAVVAGAAAMAFVAPAAHAATPHSAHPAQVSASVARTESHDLRHSADVKKNDMSSGNWSGYAASGSQGSDTSVSSSWTQPSITCGSSDTYSSFWVGLDGLNNSALEQTGTEADCIGGQAQYGAWWEVLPAAESPYSVTVAPGDQLTATVTDNGDGTFTMTLADSTQGWTKTTTHAGSSGYQDSSAEVIAEATSVGGSIANLSNFGSVNFTGSTANGSSLSGASPEKITMQNSDSGDVMASPGTLSGGDFGVTWENAS
ncbi:G1 family endopeptidase [Streptomyces sp. SL13]|uniref:G1 family endopeptidase n=1 Tax=Streptantibioticus silvisoli TaxID=2705255 RepID=A0AA90H5J4_9ACTN|nr:G1 family glutamic endopeptidase [Streptantibioticus silvisoli]MDI5961704.1 G1 family endopeptidase [Streptantibioticus silvisoli]MDI5972321.1 G1 family endopeptidase [Streptantibioticus silvisoli]